MVLKEGRLICSKGPKTLKVTNDALLPTVSFPIVLVTWGNGVNRWNYRKLQSKLNRILLGCHRYPVYSAEHQGNQMGGERRP